MDVAGPADNSCQWSWAFWDDQGLNMTQLNQLLSVSQPVVTTTAGSTAVPVLATFIAAADFRPIVLTKIGHPDVLGDFFGKDINALLIMNDEGATTIPFMDKLGIVWIQESFDKWVAYDRDEFFKFINDDAQIDFYGPRLTKEQVMRKLAEPNNG